MTASSLQAGRRGSSAVNTVGKLAAASALAHTCIAALHSPTVSEQDYKKGEGQWAAQLFNDRGDASALLLSRNWVLTVSHNTPAVPGELQLGWENGTARSGTWTTTVAKTDLVVHEKSYIQPHGQWGNFDIMLVNVTNKQWIGQGIGSGESKEWLPDSLPRLQRRYTKQGVEFSQTQDAGRSVFAYGRGFSRTPNSGNMAFQHIMRRIEIRREVCSSDNQFKGNYTEAEHCMEGVLFPFGIPDEISNRVEAYKRYGAEIDLTPRFMKGDSGGGVIRWSSDGRVPFVEGVIQAQVQHDCNTARFDYVCPSDNIITYGPHPEILGWILNTTGLKICDANLEGNDVTFVDVDLDFLVNEPGSHERVMKYEDQELLRGKYSDKVCTVTRTSHQKGTQTVRCGDDEFEHEFEVACEHVVAKPRKDELCGKPGYQAQEEYSSNGIHYLDQAGAVHFNTQTRWDYFPCEIVHYGCTGIYGAHRFVETGFTWTLNGGGGCFQDSCDSDKVFVWNGGPEVQANWFPEFLSGVLFRFNPSRGRLQVGKCVKRAVCDGKRKQNRELKPMRRPGLMWGFLDREWEECTCKEGYKNIPGELQCQAVAQVSRPKYHEDPTPQVSCGNHKANNCTECPAVRVRGTPGGVHYCNGACKWNAADYTCNLKEVSSSSTRRLRREVSSSSSTKVKAVVKAGLEQRPAGVLVAGVAVVLAAASLRVAAARKRAGRNAEVALATVVAKDCVDLST